jgi:hypothetical protein
VYQDSGIPKPGEPSPLDGLPVEEQLAAELTIEQAVAELRLYAGETEGEKPEPVTRDSLAEMFEAIRGKPTDQDEEWDW